MPEDLATAWVAIRPDLSGFETELVAEVQADTAAASGTVQVGGDFSTLRMGAAAAVSQLESDLIARLRTTIAPAMDTAAEGSVQAQLNAIGAEVLRPTVAPELDPSVLAALSGARTSVGASAIATLLGLATGDSGGDSGGGGGFSTALAAMGWGGGKLGMASLGSLLSLMGFGAEHVIATGLGVGGSIAGAGLGAGFLGLGMLGTAGVGMGTDMAGMGQALNDIKSVYQAQVQLNQAVAQYGPASSQAAAAQANYNQVLGSFSSIAQGAVAVAANTAIQFHALFNQATGEAEKTGAEIINQAMQVGETFLPTIGKYAAENMGIIQKDLQPLFTWLSSPTGGLGIFTNLEQLFQNELPTAMRGFDNGIELLAKTIDIAAQSGGRFITWISDFVTKMNTTDFSKWSSFVQNMIGLFDTWFGLLIQVGKTVYDLFLPAVGLGKAIAETFTGLFKQLDSWLTNPATQNALHDLFVVHMQEVLEALNGAGQIALGILEALAGAFMRAATIGAGLVVVALKPIELVLEAVGKALQFVMSIPLVNYLTSWAGGLLIFGLAVKSAWTGITGLVAALLNLVKALAVDVVGGLETASLKLGVMEGPIANLSTATTDWAATGKAASVSVEESLAGVSAAVDRLTAQFAGLDTATAGMGTAAAGAAAPGMVATESGLLVPEGAALGVVAADATEASVALGGVTAAASGLLGPIALLGAGALLVGTLLNKLSSDSLGVAANWKTAWQAAVKLGTSSTNIGQVSNALSELNKLLATGATVWHTSADVIDQQFGPAIQQVETHLVELETNVKPHLDALVTDLQHAGEAGMASLVQSITDGIPKTTSAAQLLEGSAGQKLAQLAIDAQATGNQATANLINSFIDHTAEAAAAAGGMNAATEQMLQQLETELRSIGDTSAANFVQALLGGVADSQAAANQIAEGVKGPLASLYNQLWGLGNSAAQGFVLGISSEIGPAGVAMAQLVDVAVAEAHAHLQNPPTPSLVFQELGRSAGEGFVVGITSQIGNARSAASSLLAAAISPFVSVSGSTGVGAFAGTALPFDQAPTTLQVNYGGVVIHAPTGNAPDIAKAVQSALEQHDTELLNRVTTYRRGR